MARRRVLLVGFGRIGREVFYDYRDTLTSATLMVTDPACAVPVGYEWDGRAPVDLAAIMVDTPGVDGGFDYDALLSAMEQYLEVAEFLLVRSTVALDFLDLDVYRDNAHRIGFSPEFHGTTRHSRRGELDLGFTLLSDTVPKWFATAIGRALRGTAAEVIVAKLAENAYLATKVTFFHELFLLCERHGLSFDAIRRIVTSDPRITPHHSYCDDGIGWSSHCFDKDVPVYADLAGDGLVAAMVGVNRALLARR